MSDCDEVGSSPQISSLIDALKIGHGDDGYEGSEPMAVGGPQGSYSLRSPFTGSCQFKVDSVVAGNSNGVAVLGRNRITQTPGLAATDSPTGELGPIPGLVLVGQSNNMIPVASEWYDVTDSSNVIFCVITTTTAMYINVKFRQKRK